MDKCVAVLMFLSMATSCYGQGLQCTASQRKLLTNDVGSLDGCVCGTDNLKNIKITLPQGLELSVVCDLSGRLASDSSWHAIDPRVSKINLDVWDGNRGVYGLNDIYGGLYYFSGSMRLRGKIRYEFGGEENYVRFIHDDFSALNKIFYDQNLKDIIVVPNYYSSSIPRGLEIPKIEYPSSLKDDSGYCTEASAEVLVSGIKVVNFGSDDDGTYVSNFKLLRVGRFSECRGDKN